jgi:hypothetical protein
MKTRREFLVMACGAAVIGPRTIEGDLVPTMLDHILLGCGDLERGIAFVEEKAGVKAAFGGVHPGRGTQNALLSLGERHYLEIIAPDPQQSGDELASRLQKLTAPELIGWAIHPGNLQDYAARLAKAGIVTQGPTPGSRKRPDGKILQWATLALQNDGDGLLPFSIEWSAGTVHPSADAPKGCSIEKFWVESPGFEELAKQLELMALYVDLRRGEKARLRARIKGLKGEFEL